jgi:hypothetical protein
MLLAGGPACIVERAAMKVTTEEAFLKVLQMHGIEHAFGVIDVGLFAIGPLPWWPAACVRQAIW